jgi:regulatory protein
MTRAPRSPRKPPPAPTEASLHEAALTYLSRYAAPQAGVLRVLDRRIARWAASDDGDQDRAREARQVARRIVAQLAETGAISDSAFAQARSRSLRRAGKSARAIGAHLASRGVTADVTDAGKPPDDLGAAAIHIRRRRLGPFRVTSESPDSRRKELASLARAGFPHTIASAALRLSREEAETLITRFRDDIA